MTDVGHGFTLVIDPFRNTIFVMGLIKLGARPLGALFSNVNKLRLKANCNGLFGELSLHTDCGRHADGNMIDLCVGIIAEIERGT